MDELLLVSLPFHQTEGLKEFEGFLKTFQLNFIPNKRSKIQRCIEAKEEQK